MIPSISDTLTSVNSAARIPFFSCALKNPGVQRIDQIHRERLKMLIKEAGSQAALSVKVGKSPAQISQWVNASKDSKTGKPRAMDRATTRELEAKCGKPEGWMDQPIEAHGTKKGAVFQALSSEEEELISHWRHLLGKDRRAKLAEIAAIAQERLAEKEELFAEAGITGIMERAANAVRQQTESTAVDPQDPRLKQHPLFPREDVE